MTEGLGAWAGAFADALEGLGPAAMEAESGEVAAQAAMEAEGGGAAAQAAADQVAGDYNADAWTNTTLQPGDTVVQGYAGEGSYYTSLDQVDSGPGTLSDYNENLQIEPDSDYPPRQGLTVYQVTEPIDIAVSQALANPDFGAGGWTQFFIPPGSGGLYPIGRLPFLP